MRILADFFKWRSIFQSSTRFVRSIDRTRESLEESYIPIDFIIEVIESERNYILITFISYTVYILFLYPELPFRLPTLLFLPFDTRKQDNEMACTHGMIPLPSFGALVFSVWNRYQPLRDRKCNYKYRARRISRARSA